MLSLAGENFYRFATTRYTVKFYIIIITVNKSPFQEVSLRFVSYCVVLYCIVLYCIVLHCIILCCIELSCTRHGKIF